MLLTTRELKMKKITFNVGRDGSERLIVFKELMKLKKKFIKARAYTSVNPVLMVTASFDYLYDYCLRYCNFNLEVYYEEN